MRLYRDGSFVDDSWVTVGDDEAVPDGGDIIVSQDRWRAEYASLSKCGGKIGFVIQPDGAIDDANDHVGKVDLIVIVFPKFSDGRGYSLARILREQLGYEGALRARGEVLLDQVALMWRCGFTELEIEHGPTIEALERGHLPAITHSYQSARSSRFEMRKRRQGSGPEKVAAE